MSKDIDVAIIGAQLEKGIVRPIPAIQHFLHYIVMIIQLKANRIFIGSRS